MFQSGKKGNNQIFHWNSIYADCQWQAAKGPNGNRQKKILLIRLWCVRASALRSHSTFTWSAKGDGNKTRPRTNIHTRDDSHDEQIHGMFRNNAVNIFIPHYNTYIFLSWVLLCVSLAVGCFFRLFLLLPFLRYVSVINFMAQFFLRFPGSVFLNEWKLNKSREWRTQNFQTI